MVALSASAFGLSAFMSNAAATAIILPIALAASAGTSRRYQAAMVLAIAWAASMGGLATPVGTPPNLIGVGQLRTAGVEFGFVDWVAVGLPIGAAMLVAMWLVLFALFRVRGEAVHLAPARMPRWRRGEYSIAVVLAVAVCGWLAPSAVELVAPGSAAARWTKVHVTEEVVAVLAGALLFVLPGGAAGARRPALTWAEATRIDWGVILLFGGGILLGELARSTGLVGICCAARPAPARAKVRRANAVHSAVMATQRASRRAPVRKVCRRHDRQCGGSFGSCSATTLPPNLGACLASPPRSSRRSRRPAAWGCPVTAPSWASCSRPRVTCLRLRGSLSLRRAKCSGAKRGMPLNDT